MGLRTQRYGPTATNRRGASHGPGVPRPTLAKSQMHERYKAAPMTIRLAAYHAAGVGIAPPRVRIHHGIHTAPEPGTTTVNKTFRISRLIAYQLPRNREGCSFVIGNGRAQLSLRASA